MQLLNGRILDEFAEFMTSLKGWSIFCQTGPSHFYSNDDFVEVQIDEPRIAQWPEDEPLPNLFLTKLGFLCSNKDRLIITGNIVAIEWQRISSDEVIVKVCLAPRPDVQDGDPVTWKFAYFRASK